ncbi:transferase [Mycena belliarum]|uniref:Transferase n=1 Tax=Mycena belliarum TaxID=1033014 RepID=A0AAD6UHF5_9AGAR|nr:transferase [Mycena belliae]
MNAVTITSQRTVRSLNESSWTSLLSPFRLGPTDLLVAAFIPIAVVFVYDQPPEVERLQRALAGVLDYYPQLTGRLQINDDGMAEVASLGTGAVFLEAQCGARLEEFSSGGRTGLQNLPGAGNALLAPYNAADVVHEPIFTIQHTRFACGAAALGVRVLHTLCDAEGFFQLVQDLAELYRADADTPSLAHPPHIQPYPADMTPEDQAKARKYTPSLFYVEPSVPVEDTQSSPTHGHSFPPPPPPVTGRFLRFSSSDLNVLKARATDPESPSSWVSTFDTLCAHLHQRVYRARVQLRTQDATNGELSPPDFLTPVNIRRRIGTTYLPARYFPNALITTYTSFVPDVLATGPLWQIASTLHDMTRTPATTAPGELDRTLRWLAAQDKRRVRQGFRYGNGSLMLSQWNKVDMYGSAVFEARPVLVAPPFTPTSLLDGLGYFLPTEEHGTIEVALALSDPVWAVLDYSV